MSSGYGWPKGMPLVKGIIDSPPLKYRRERKEIVRKQEQERLLKDFCSGLEEAVADEDWTYKDLFYYLPGD
jgi:hypothetical protein